jgi:hypothetical protein
MVSRIDEKRFEAWAKDKPFFDEIGGHVRELVDRNIIQRMAYIDGAVDQKEVYEWAYCEIMRLLRPDIVDKSERTKAIIAADRQAYYERCRFHGG